MKNLNNEYEKLLRYLQDQDNESKNETPVKEPKAKKIEQTSLDTNKLIEDSKIHSFVPEYEPSKSKGFNVRKFENMMRTKLVEEYKKLQSYERPYISVSEICTCLRQSYYSRNRYPINISEKFSFSYLYLIQKAGDLIHSVIEELYDFSETEKTVVSEKYKVKGRVDGIRESYLYEIKSIDPNKFKNEYLPEHYIQGLVYAYILNSEYEYNIRTITIIYVIRTLKKIVPFDIKVDNKLAESLLNRALILKRSLTSSKVPDPIGSTIDHCKFCPYRKKCEVDTPEKISQPFFKKKKKPENQKEVEKEKDKNTAFLL